MRRQAAKSGLDSGKWDLAIGCSCNTQKDKRLRSPGRSSALLLPGIESKGNGRRYQRHSVN